CERRSSRTPDDIHHAPAHALRRGPLPGRPRVPGDGGPVELPGPFRDSPSLEGRRKLPGSLRLSEQPARPPEAAGAHAGRSHGLELGFHRIQDASIDAGREDDVVAADVEALSQAPLWLAREARTS